MDNESKQNDVYYISEKVAWTNGEQSTLRPTRKPTFPQCYSM